MLSNKEYRKEIAWMTWHSKEGHIPSAFSIIDLISFLYKEYLNINKKNYNKKNRDYFILSKGHGCSALYVVLKELGFISRKDLLEKNAEFAKLATHPDRVKIKAVEASTGSLGNGIGFSLGIALGNKIKNIKSKVITIIGDGESNEGLVWECALLGSFNKLGNLCVILDNNKSCEPTLALPNAKEKWKSFGWETYEIDGHNTEEIRKLFNNLDFSLNSKPKAIIANTIKGKGVPQMEQNYGHWHSRVPSNEEISMINREIDNYE